MSESKEARYEQAHRDRAVQEEYQQDGYKSRGKLAEPAVCPACKAVYHKGRWTWASAPKEAHHETCPACHRIHDKYPAGHLTLSGPFLQAHQDEILNLIRHEEKKAKAEHPLRRVMAIEKRNDGFLITTTDTHLPQRIGSALKHAHGGELQVQYAKDEYLVRATWTR
jgi:NMD protein affecting ribosome stability and mRNA decay